MPLDRSRAFSAAALIGAFSLPLAANISAQTSSEEYSYDALGRLVIAETSGGTNDGETHSLCYDSAGNRTQYSATSDASVAACVDQGSGPVGPGEDPEQEPPPPTNNPPTTTNDSVTVPCDLTITVNLTANDSDPEGNTPLSLTAISGNGMASATIVSASSVSVTAGSINSTTTFTYTVADALGATSNGTLTVTTNNCSMN